MTIIDKDFITVNTNATSKTDIINLAGELFRKKGAVKEGYEEATIKREEKFPTGLQAENTAVAIPHTDVTYANRTAIGCIVPKQPIQFMAMGTEDEVLNCEIIFPIIVSESEKQVEVLRELMTLFRDSTALSKIKNAQNPEEVMKVLEVLNKIIQKS